MIKEMKGWKVVKGLGLYTWSAGNSSNFHKIEYFCNRMSRPSLKGSKLFFFPDKKDAERFAGTFSYSEVLPCTAYNCNKLKIIAAEIGDIRLFWKRKNQKKGVVNSMSTTKAPQGTWVADRIMIGVGNSYD